jgi:hypothetical protein
MGEKGAKLPLEISLVLSDVLVSLVNDDFAKAWSLVKQALHRAGNLQDLDGQQLAQRMTELLEVLDETLRVRYGKEWSTFIGQREENLPSETELRCSFCRKSMGEVTKLFSGSRFYICNECLDLCKEVVVTGTRSGN